MSDEFVGVAEAAEVMGISRQRVVDLFRTKPEFPAAVAVLKCGTIWRRDEIVRYDAARNKATGRPPRDQSNFDPLANVAAGLAHVIRSTFRNYVEQQV